LEFSVEGKYLVGFGDEAEMLKLESVFAGVVNTLGS
jgi:hypothetical protein